MRRVLVAALAAFLLPACRKDRVLTPVSEWTGAALLEDQPGTVASAPLAVDGAGQAHAAWSQGDGVRYSIWGSRSR